MMLATPYPACMGSCYTEGTPVSASAGVVAQEGAEEKQVWAVWDLLSCSLQTGIWSFVNGRRAPSSHSPTAQRLLAVAWRIVSCITEDCVETAHSVGEETLGDGLFPEFRSGSFAFGSAK